MDEQWVFFPVEPAGGFVGGRDAALFHLAQQAGGFAHVAGGGKVDTAAPEHAAVLELAVFAFLVGTIFAAITFSRSTPERTSPMTTSIRVSSPTRRSQGYKLPLGATHSSS